MGLIAEESIRAVLESTDIVELISSYIPLKRAGGLYKTNCPFHDEKTPSFVVTPTRQSYHCFGCGAGGNAINFVMAYEGLPFPESVKKLAKRANIPLAQERYDPHKEKKEREKTHILELLKESTHYLHSLLLRSPDASHARDYLATRGYDIHMAKHWKIGWMPQDPHVFFQWAKQKGFGAKDLLAGDLAGLRNPQRPQEGLYLRFSNRLMFPICNDYGEPIAFSARQIIPDSRSGKYVNSKETILFKKSRTFFALDRARRAIAKEQKALLCEGQMDVIACHEAGISIAIAPLGTAVTPEHVSALKRYTKEIILCFDGDAAGQKAALKAFGSFASQGFYVRTMALPHGEDPDSFLKKEGKEGFESIMEHAEDFFLYTLHQQDTEALPRQRAQSAEHLASLIACIQDPLLRDPLILQVATHLTLPVDSIRQLVKNADKIRQKESKKTSQYLQADTPLPTVEATKLSPPIATLCHLALTSQEAQERLCEQLESLQEALQTLPDGEVLLSILGKTPSPDNPVAIQTYLSSIRQEDSLALQALFSRLDFDKPLQAVEDSCSMLLSAHYQHKEVALRSKLRHPNLSPEELAQTLRQITSIQELLKELPQRFIR